MDDLISRQAAIDEIDEWIKAFRESGHKESAADARFIRDGIIQLSSAQPEIIRCKDCKHYLNSNEKCALIDTRLNFYATDKRWNDDSFCSWADMRGTDE